ncbi:MAG: nicotinate (nicotinamide) nucleotide adenylyltransferase [Chitinophagales bacterium]
MTKNIGLYFGSFNPIHIGHLLVATHMREAAQLNEIWFIVSPQNPFKLNTEMAPENHRLEMVKLAVKNTDYFKVSDIEFSLEKPSYTHLTLKALSKQFPEHQFHLIIGEDNVPKLHEWKEADWILNNYKVLVYNRNTNSRIKPNDYRLLTIDLPMFDISATEIRQRIKNQQSVQYFVPENVEQYIRFHKLYL